MTVFALRACAMLLGLAPLLAAAQSLPRPAEFYFDEDAAVARPVVAIAGSDEATIVQLVRLMDRGGRNADRAAAQLAHLSMASGRTDNGRALYERALQMVTPRGQQHNAMRWNYGWDLYRLGDVEGALAQWTEAGVNRSVVYPAWAPPTLALALWQLDRRTEAVSWYAAAVRTYPERWSNPAQLPALLPDWTEADRTTLAEVLAAWRQDPPAWP
jgi:tetratricopeptide (TPR) repeat protein